MKLHLNAKIVADLKPGKKRLAYFDEKEPGFCVRVTPTGVKSFAGFFRHEGRLRLFTIGEISKWSLEDARKKAREVKRSSSLGEDLAAKKRQERQADSFA